jgi:hypothetical protein
MAEQEVNAIDQSLVLFDNGVPDELKDGCQFTWCLAQAHARTVNPDPTTNAWFMAMHEELARLGWNVLKAEKVGFNQQQGRVSPAAIVKGIMQDYLTAEDKTKIEHLVDAIKMPSQDQLNFVNFWHPKTASTNPNKHAMALGVVKNTNAGNSISVTILYYGFDFSATADRWFGMDINADSMNLDVYQLQANLGLAVWNSESEAVKAKVGTRLTSHVQTQTYDL